MKKLLAVIAAACLLASACGNDDDSPAEAPPATEAPAPATAEPTAAPEPAMTPEPTAAPEPASTPEPTAAPEPTQAAEEEPPPSMDTLVFDSDTTGGDVAERLTDAESDCTQAALGDDYGLLAVTPLGSLREVGVETGLLGCLAHENLLLVATAVIDARFGGRTPETSECVREVYRSTPDALYRNFGLEWEGPSASPEEISNTIQSLYQCMNPRERAIWMLGMWDRMSAATPDRGSDYVELLTADEIACATEAVGEEAAEEVLGQRPVQVWRAYPAVHDCFPPATIGKLFAQFTANRIGGVADSSLQCLEDFTAQRPDFVIAIANGPSGESFEDVDVSQFALDVFAFYGCLDTEERGRLQSAFLGDN